MQNTNKPAARRFKHRACEEKIEIRGNDVYISFNGEDYVLRKKVKPEEVIKWFKKDLFIELPAETEPDIFSEEGQAIVRKAWAENQLIPRDRCRWDSDRTWEPHDGYYDWEGHLYYYRFRQPKPPEPKRIPLSGGFVYVRVNSTGKIEFLNKTGDGTVPVYGLNPEDLGIINKLGQDNQ